VSDPISRHRARAGRISPREFTQDRPYWALRKPFVSNLLDGNHDYYGAKEICTAVQEVGEALQFGIEPDNVMSFLADFGFEVSSHYNSGDLEQTYLSSHGEQLGEVYGFAACVTAVRT
jgi:hypothetical protein